ncbi:hypothetical protein KCP76_11235 [Salmonella enterica subsp. enterica serovar Weltevreden]|nr:hypothetical protein KCP76_11235 [Salmonella enterica subsp. enterica serovar Weltevreden]
MLPNAECRVGFMAARSNGVPAAIRIRFTVWSFAVRIKAWKFRPTPAAERTPSFSYLPRSPVAVKQRIPSRSPGSSVHSCVLCTWVAGTAPPAKLSIAGRRVSAP